MKENKIEKLIFNLSNRWDCSPQEVVDRLNSMNESEINKLINSMTKKFKNGGMIDCLRKGGSIKDCSCGSKINKAADGEKLPYARPGWFRSTFRRFSNVPEYPRYDGNGTFSGEIVGSDTLHVVNGPYTTFTEQRTPEGRYIDDTTGGRYYVPGSESKGFMRTAAPEDLIKMFDNVRNRFESTPKKACGGSIEKAELGTQIGGKISKVARSTMFDDAKELMPEVDRQFVRQSYRTAKKHGRDLGLRGWSLRNWSKNQVSDRFREYADNSPVTMPVRMPQLPVLEDVVIEDEPIVMDEGFTKLDSSTPTVQKIDRFGGNFNSAFAAARRSGLGEFEWNGKRYSTRLASAAPLGKVQPFVNKIMTGEGDPAATKRSESAAVWYPGRSSK